MNRPLNVCCFFSVMVLAFISFNASASEMISVFVDEIEGKEDCKLRERGWKDKENPIIIEGDLNGYYVSNDSKMGCSVHLSKETFDDHFKFCSLGKISSFTSESSRPYGLNSCSVHNTDEGFEFSDYWAPLGDFGKTGSCGFNCLTK